MARGFAIGAMVNFFPTFGFGVVISGALAGLLRCNVVAGVVGGAVFAVLWPLLFYFNMRVGSLLYDLPAPVDSIEEVDDRTIDALVQGKTFLAGAIVNGVVVSLVVYAIAYYLHSRYRERVLRWLFLIKHRCARGKPPE